MRAPKKHAGQGRRRSGISISLSPCLSHGRRNQYFSIGLIRMGGALVSLFFFFFFSSRRDHTFNGTRFMSPRRRDAREARGIATVRRGFVIVASVAAVVIVARNNRNLYCRSDSAGARRYAPSRGICAGRPAKRHTRHGGGQSDGRDVDTHRGIAAIDFFCRSPWTMTFYDYHCYLYCLLVIRQ